MSGLGGSRQNGIGFNAKVRRFDADRPEEILGPGSYVIKEELTKSASTGGFMAKGLRSDSVGVNPGPGTYFEDDVDAKWNKKSFNIIFSELS